MKSKVALHEEPGRFSEKIPLEVMRNIWNDKENTYTDEQLTKMREWAYTLVDVIFDIAKTNERNKITHLNSNDNEQEKSNTIYPGEYRRAS